MASPAWCRKRPWKYQNINTLSISHSIKIFCWLNIISIDQYQGIPTSRSMKIWRSENQWTAFAHIPDYHPHPSLTRPECHLRRKRQITGKSAGKKKIALHSFEILQQRHHFPVHCALCTARGRFLLSTLSTLVTGGVGQDRSHPSIIRLKKQQSRNITSTGEYGTLLLDGRFIQRKAGLTWSVTSEEPSNWGVSEKDHLVD